MTWGEQKRPLSVLSKLLSRLYRLISYIPPLKLHSWIKIFVSQLTQILKGGNLSHQQNLYLIMTEFIGTFILFFLHILFYFLTLQYCIGFAIDQHEFATGIHVFPILNPPPSPYHPSGSSQCTSPKHPVSCIEPGLATRFIYDIICVSCHSPKSSHPLPLPQSPKDCYIHQCLFCCLVYLLLLPSF